MVKSLHVLVAQPIRLAAEDKDDLEQPYIGVFTIERSEEDRVQVSRISPRDRVHATDIGAFLATTSKEMLLRYGTSGYQIHFHHGPLPDLLYLSEEDHGTRLTELPRIDIEEVLRSYAAHLPESPRTQG